MGGVRDLQRLGDLRVRIGTRYTPETLDVGASVACDGCCLTVVDRGQDAEGAWFDVSISAESLSKTALGDWDIGSVINLERSLKVGDELGGHIVLGHVDGVAQILRIVTEGDSLRFTFQAPKALAKFIAPKGSVALNGTSLTVNEVDGACFGVNLIPHTLSVTTWGSAQVGDNVNLEIDPLARYVARLQEWRAA